MIREMKKENRPLKFLRSLSQTPTYSGRSFLTTIAFGDGWLRPKNLRLNMEFPMFGKSERKSSKVWKDWRSPQGLRRGRFAVSSFAEAMADKRKTKLKI